MTIETCSGGCGAQVITHRVIHSSYSVSGLCAECTGHMQALFSRQKAKPKIVPACDIKDCRRASTDREYHFSPTPRHERYTCYLCHIHAAQYQKI